MCSVYFSLESKCRPRYLAVGNCRITVLFMCTTGHCSFLSVKVTCTDFVTLMLIRHFLAKFLVGLDDPVAMKLNTTGNEACTHIFPMPLSL
jgi:hypothetical protein